MTMKELNKAIDESNDILRNSYVKDLRKAEESGDTKAIERCKKKLDDHDKKVKESKRKYLILKIAGIIILIEFIILSIIPNTPTNSGGSGNSITCGSCGRSFSSTSSNGKSIKSTGMCSNCYGNFKYASPNAALHISPASINEIYRFLHNDCDYEVWFDDIKTKVSLNRIMITGSDNT
ncbi:MAG: hypothetical protein NC395_00485 [Prevotella sp.]|nr:hypothetical protein [Prevotella sp.]